VEWGEARRDASAPLPEKGGAKILRNKYKKGRTMLP